MKEQSERWEHKERLTPNRNLQRKKRRDKKITKERNIKTENTFSVLQKEDTKPLLEEKESLLIVKIVKIKKRDN